MTAVSLFRVVHHDVDTCAGSGHAAPGLSAWLGLAATPTFAIMALWSAFFSGRPGMPCMPTQDPSTISGMTLMYLLMSAFHLSPWLKRISTRRCARRHAPGASENPKPLDTILGQARRR